MRKVKGVANSWRTKTYKKSNLGFNISRTQRKNDKKRRNKVYIWAVPCDMEGNAYTFDSYKDAKYCAREGVVIGDNDGDVFLRRVDPKDKTKIREDLYAQFDDDGKMTYDRTKTGKHRYTKEEKKRYKKMRKMDKKESKNYDSK